jgi:hypothetical protein
MTKVEGGLVLDSIAYPRGAGWFAVRGRWTGGNWKPGLRLNLGQYRGGLFVGKWRLVGVDLLSKVPRETVLILSPDDPDSSFAENDIVAFGPGAYSSFNIKSLDPPLEDGRILEVSDRGYKAVVRGRSGGGQELIVFHEAGQDFGHASFRSAKSSHERHDISLEYNYTCNPEYSVEFCLNGSKVGVGILVDSLSLARSFVLATGQEKMGIIRSTGGRYPFDITRIFDPIVTAKAGSVHVFLHTPPPVQVLKFPRELPLQLLARSLRAAAIGDEAGVRELLKEHVISIDASILQLKKIVNVSLRHNGIDIRSSDNPVPVPLGIRARSTLEKCEAAFQTQTVIRDGFLFGVNFKNRWCLFSLTDETHAWTLRFSPELEGKIRGRFPRAVNVTFETRSPLDSPRGTGALLDIQELEPETGLGL